MDGLAIPFDRAIHDVTDVKSSADLMLVLALSVESGGPSLSENSRALFVTTRMVNYNNKSGESDE